MRRTCTIGWRRLVLVLGLVPFVAGCSVMRADVAIDAPPDRVWRILTDFDAYATWNPFFVSAHGSLCPGQGMAVVMQPVGKSSQSFSPTILDVQDGHEVTWRGRVLMPFLFDGVHHFLVEPLGPGRTRFVQYEEFNGIFVPFVGFEPYRLGWEKMNAALKKRAEAHEP